MQRIGFLTPIVYGEQRKSCSETLLEKAEGYLSLGREKACVVAGCVKSGKKGTLLFQEERSPCLLTALKVLSYCTLVIPLIALLVKAILRCKHQFYQAGMEAGGRIDEAKFQRLVGTAKAKIQELISVIEGRKGHSQIEWLSEHSILVFRLKDIPEIVFKLHMPNAHALINGKLLDGEGQIQSRFANMGRAKSVCLVHGLNSLVVPQAQLFSVQSSSQKPISIIAEEFFEAPMEESAQEELYRSHSDKLDRIAQQLATLVLKTGFNDVAWRNIPLVPSPQGDYSVALIDLEHLGGGVSEGFLGSWNGSSGLVRCLFSEKQIDAVLSIAMRQGSIKPQEAQEAKEKRMREIQRDVDLQEFYQRKGILEDHKKPLVVDWETLGISLEETGAISIPDSIETGTDSKPHIKWRKEEVTMREVAKAVVEEINQCLGEAKENKSVKGKRAILIKVNNNGMFGYYNSLGAPKGCLIKEGEEKQFWLRRIIDALVEKGYLFRFIKANGHGYFVQA